MGVERPVDNVIIATKGLQDRNTNIIAGTAVENKGKLILANTCFKVITISPVNLYSLTCLNTSDNTCFLCAGIVEDFWFLR